MFTPGPWEPGRDGQSIIAPHEPEPDYELALHYGGRVICETITPSNQRLVALAPEMYDLLLDIKQAGRAGTYEVERWQERAGRILRRADGART